MRQRLYGVQSGQIGNAMPCTDWDVQALINHNTNVTGFIEGALQENMTVNPLDVSGPSSDGNVLELLNAGIAKVIKVMEVAESDSLDLRANTPFGEMTRGEFLINPTWDLLMHS